MFNLQLNQCSQILNFTSATLISIQTQTSIGIKIVVKTYSYAITSNLVK